MSVAPGFFYPRGLVPPALPLIYPREAEAGAPAAALVYDWAAGDALPSGYSAPSGAGRWRLWHASSYASATFQEASSGLLEARLSDNAAGLMLVEPIQNKLDRSNDFSNTYWGLTRTTSAAVAGSIFGGNRYKIAADASDTNWRGISRSPTGAAGDYFILIADDEAKSKFMNYINGGAGHTHRGYDLLTGATSTVGSYTDAAAGDYGTIALPGGRWLCWLRRQTATNSWFIELLDAFASDSYAAVSGEGIYLEHAGIGPQHPGCLVVAVTGASAASLPAYVVSADLSAQDTSALARCIRWKDVGNSAYGVWSGEIAEGAGLFLEVAGGYIQARWTDPGHAEVGPVGVPLVVGGYNEVCVSVGTYLKIAQRDGELIKTPFSGTKRQIATETWGKVGSSYLNAPCTSAKGWSGELTDAEVRAACGAHGGIRGTKANFRSLGNIAMRHDGSAAYQVGIRGRAAKSGTVTAIRTAFVNFDGGYGAGTGGDILIERYAVGSDGLRTGSPTEVGHHLNGRGDASLITRLVTLDTPFTTVEGQLFWLNFRNVDADPANNYVSVDFGRRMRHTPSDIWYQDPDCQGYGRYGNGVWFSGDGDAGEFYSGGLQPFLELHYSDGSKTHHPSAHYEAATWYTGVVVNNHTGLIGGNNRVRQSWDLPGGETYKEARFFVGRAYGDAGSAALQLAVKSGGTTLFTESVAAAGIAFEPDPATVYVGGAQVVRFPFTTPWTPAAGTYHTELLAASGTLYRTGALRKATDVGFDASGVIAGSAMYSTDGGSNWLYWKYGNQNPVDRFDLMYAQLVKAA